MTDEHGPFDANDPAHRLYNHAEVAALVAAARREGMLAAAEIGHKAWKDGFHPSEIASVIRAEAAAEGVAP